MSDQVDQQQEGQQGEGQEVNQQSAAWGGGFTQETGSWCFAATEQTLQYSFGTQVTQEEIAHNVMIANGVAGASQTATAYLESITIEIVSAFDLPNTDYATVQAYLSDEHRQTLQNNWGDLPLTGRTFQTGGALSEAEIMQTIDGGGLIAFGNAVHWKIIYGYTANGEGQITAVWVFDPMTGGETAPDYQTVSGQMQISHRVTG